MDRIEFTPDEIRVAGDWHGGGGSMLYAISSTEEFDRRVRKFWQASPGTFVEKR